MPELIAFEEGLPHKVSETICVKCGYRSVDVRPVGVPLKRLECGGCHLQGFIVETGETVGFGDEELRGR